MKTNYSYEILTLDSKGLTTIKSDKNLAFSLMSNDLILKNPKLKGNKIHDENLNLTFEISQISQEEEQDFNIKNTFIIKLNGDFETVEKIRILVLKHLQISGLDQTYILTDEVSEKISTEIYPKINYVENLFTKICNEIFCNKIRPQLVECNC